MLQLKENSITAKLYRWFYAKKGMPTNLCPYFWKVVIMYTFILPYTLFCLPVIVIKPFRTFQKDTLNTNRVFGSLLIYVMWFFIACMLYVVFVFFGVKLHKEFAAMGVIGWSVLFFIGIGILITHLKDKSEEYKWENRDIKTVNTPKVSLIKEFISAKYHKYCPQITWKK
jgi:hypothetical protein